MDNEHSPTAFDQVSNWFSRSVTVKLFMILVLALLLLIPASMIKGLIQEREALHDNTVYEVSHNWAAEQEIGGPVITIPVFKQNDDGTNQWMDYFHILPEQLSISGNIDPQELHRGMYTTYVYRSQLSVEAEFDTTLLRELIGSERVIDWQKAVVSIGIPDMRGIEQEITLRINGTPHPVQAGVQERGLFNSGVSAHINLMEIGGNDKLTLQFDLNLQGSEGLHFLPLGNTTRVQLTSSWQDPSFSGAFLPDMRKVSDAGFSAEWQILQLNRNYPQIWSGNTYNEGIKETAFGVELTGGANDYQKSMRSVKYAILTIALTFLVFFLTEAINKKRIHPFQYILVGLALCLFYVLLISLSEQMAFDVAYGISALVIVAMITLYSRTFYVLWKHSLLLMGVLIGLYGYLYVTLQATDYALLIGSAGLTIMLALTMYLTRRVNWYSTT